MTIRSGGGPRDRRPAQASPYDPAAYASGDDPLYVPNRPDGRGGRRRGGGPWGLIRFLLFTLVLAGLVLVVGLTALRPVVDSAVVAWAADNPSALSIPFVREAVVNDLGSKLTSPASADTSQVEFIVNDGDTASGIAARLQSGGFLLDQRAFIYYAVQRDLTGSLRAGTFLLRQSMTPNDLVTALLDPPAVQYVDIALRTGLRLEQITAKLETIDGLSMDPHDFYDLVTKPPKELLDDYPWLEKIFSDAGVTNPTLEGFLWPSTYRVLPDTTAEELVRIMLDRFVQNVGPDRMAVPASRGLTFYGVLSLASIVEHEAVVDEERPLIAGVYQNRLDGLPGIRNRILNADPTVIYANDTVALTKLPFEQWKTYTFWNVPDVAMKDVQLPPDLAGYQTYVNPGLIPGPIATPTLPSIDAALDPDTADKYLYFVAIPNGGGKHAFAKNDREFQALLKQYGYR